MPEIEHAVISTEGYIFHSPKALQSWAQWAQARVEEGLKSPTISHEEAMTRLDKVLENVRNKMG